MTKNKKKKMKKKQKKQRELLETQLAQVRRIVFWKIKKLKKKLFQLEKYEFSDGRLESGRQRLAGSSLCAGKNLKIDILIFWKLDV